MEVTLHEQDLDRKFQIALGETSDAASNDDRKVGGGSDTGHRRASN